MRVVDRGTVYERGDTVEVTYGYRDGQRGVHTGKGDESVAWVEFGDRATWVETKRLRPVEEVE